MKIIIDCRHIPSAFGNDGIQIIQTFYGTPEEIDQIEKSMQRKIKTALILGETECTTQKKDTSM